MGGDNNQASADKFPKHKVIFDGFGWEFRNARTARVRQLAYELA